MVSKAEKELVHTYVRTYVHTYILQAVLWDTLHAAQSLLPFPPPPRFPRTTHLLSRALVVDVWHQGVPVEGQPGSEVLVVSVPAMQACRGAAGWAHPINDAGPGQQRVPAAGFAAAVLFLSTNLPATNSM